MASTSEQVPIIVRVAGLPAASLEPFASPRCLGDLRLREELQKELNFAREQLVDRLHDAVPRATSREHRRFLLGVKRDCFNRRPLTRHRALSFWEELHRSAPELVGQVVRLEEDLEKWHAVFEETYRSERERERSELVRQLEDREFVRGLALASRSVLRHISYLTESGRSRNGRKQRRLEISLLRFVSRAAMKLSPNSTLTRVGLGAVRKKDEPRELSFVSDAMAASSKVRLKRDLGDQIGDLLLRYPPLRKRIPVVMNTSLEQFADDRFRFLCPHSWELDEKSKELLYSPARPFRIKLSSFLVSWLREQLLQHPAPYGELVNELSETLSMPGAEAVRTVDSLLDSGILVWSKPWVHVTSSIEEQLAKFLRSLPQDRGLQEILTSLDRLISAQRAYATAVDAVGALDELDEALAELWRLVTLHAGLPGTATYRSNSPTFHEDVFHSSPGPYPESEQIFEAPAAKLQEALEHLEPWMLFANLRGHRYDLLHSVVALASEKWPDRREVGVVELFEAARPLWLEYRKLATQKNPKAGWISAFNPMGLESIENLRRLKEQIWQQAYQRFADEAAQGPLRRETLQELLAPVPEHYRPLVGPCLFLQPLDADGSRWVVNRMFEGTGRFGSRFTALMSDDSRSAWVESHRLHTRILHDGESIELVDLMCSQGHNLNVHAVQTRRVVEIPGETPQLPAEQRVALSELRLRIDQDTQLPQLVDGSGQRLLPVHLGGSALDGIPALASFLAHLGPGEIIAPRAAWAKPRREGDLRIQDRWTVGNVVLLRKRWLVPTEDLRQRLDGLSDAEAFSAINRWRMAHNLPDRVFLIERIRDSRRGKVVKPQYLDFSSPIFIKAFCSTLDDQGAILGLEEMLPAPESLIRDRTGAARAIEVQLDSLLLSAGILHREEAKTVSAQTRSHCPPAVSIGSGVSNRRNRQRQLMNKEVATYL